ncbi:hypothetical protein BV898_15435 [Hypsibius exemplaris]|uniref:C2H2-type domain-containing protein n=1 Tax=Hypsibius exemplaris TaxID=2072580 RepID=A0A9X6NK76_HYPEX|nr:hypothetical protein BV898_15435 [Hypsibius exemplaris]
MLGHSGMAGTSSASQYIRADFSSPSTLDAQKSPLAMLAATCNSIGAPDLQKTIKSVELPPATKRSAAQSANGSSSSSSGGSENKRPRRSPDSLDSAPRGTGTGLTGKPEKSDRKHREKSDRESSKEKEQKEHSHREHRNTKEQKMNEDDKADRQDEASRKSPKSPAADRLKTDSGTPPKISPLTGTFSPLSSPASAAAMMSDFAARMKVPASHHPGMGGMMPRFCPDPFCFSCTQQNMHCPPHNPAALPMDYSALSSYSSLQNGLNSNKSLVCNWISPGENYCGKRFLTSEELFAHLRTHTNLSVSSLSTDPLQNSYSSYAAYLSRYPSLAAASRYSPLFKSSMPGLSPSPMTSYPGMWPTGPSPGFFSPSPYSYYRPPF